MNETGLQLRSADKIVEAMKTSKFGAKAKLIGELCDVLKPKLARTCQNGLTFERVRNAAMRLAGNAKNTKLFECDPWSLIGAINEAAGYGWEVGGVLAHAYLVPYGGVVQMQPGYKGLVDLAQRAGQVVSITLDVVHEGDDFRYTSGDDERIEHTPAMDPARHTRPINYVYAIVRLKGGGAVRHAMTSEAIDAHKEKYSKNWKSADSAWQTAWPAMAMKTVLKQLLLRGRVPMSMESQRLIAREYDETTEPTTFDVRAITIVDEHAQEDAQPTASSDGQMGERP